MSRPLFIAFVVFTSLLAFGFVGRGVVAQKAGPVDPRKPLRKVQPCVGCTVVPKSGDGYVTGARVREQAGFRGRARVLALHFGSRSGVCAEVAASCLELAPCAIVVAALIRNTSSSALFVRAGRNYVHTKLSPRPDASGWIQIPKGGYCVYRTSARMAPCNELEAYERVDIRDARNGKLVTSIEWSAKCTRCVDRRR